MKENLYIPIIFTSILLCLSVLNMFWWIYMGRRIKFAFNLINSFINFYHTPIYYFKYQELKFSFEACFYDFKYIEKKFWIKDPLEFIKIDKIKRDYLEWVKTQKKKIEK